VFFPFVFFAFSVPWPEVLLPALLMGPQGVRPKPKAKRLSAFPENDDIISKMIKLLHGIANL
jgi:hypothetical protein